MTMRNDMASKAEDVRSALDALKLVAKGYKVPFDTSELERAVDAFVADEKKADEKPVEAPRPVVKPV